MSQHNDLYQYSARYPINQFLVQPSSGSLNQGERREKKGERGEGRRGKRELFILNQKKKKVPPLKKNKTKLRARCSGTCLGVRNRWSCAQGQSSVYSEFQDRQGYTASLPKQIMGMSFKANKHHFCVFKGKSQHGSKHLRRP